jgi:uroporphyrin-3 C-methyltransferase
MTDEITVIDKEPDSDRPGKSGIGIFLFIVAIIILLGGFGYGYFQLSRINTSLASNVSELQNRVSHDQADVNALKATVSQLQQTAQKTQELSTQQEQLMSEWRSAQKGDLNKWHIAEAQYLVKLANDHLQFSQNTQMAQTLLEQADHALQSIQEPNVLELRKSIATDIANIQAVPQVDITALYLRVNALNNQIDALSLPEAVVTADRNHASAAPLPANLPWWKAGLQRTWQALRQIVIVQYNGSNTMPLIMPDEKSFLFQNLHAQMESVMWAVLHRNPDVYQANLKRTTAWIKQYFVQDSAETKSMLQNLDDLQKINIQSPAANVSATLQLFDNYFAQNRQQTANTNEGLAQ